MNNPNSYFKVSAYHLLEMVPFHTKDLVGARLAWKKVAQLKEDYDSQRPTISPGNKAPRALISMWQEPEWSGPWARTLRVGESPRFSVGTKEEVVEEAGE